MKHNSRKNKRKKQLKITKVFLVLILLVSIVFIITFIKDKNKDNKNRVNENLAIIPENTISGELNFQQDEMRDINVSNVKFIFFETSNKTAISFYFLNEKEDIENKEILVKILNGNKENITEEKINIKKLGKGQTKKINISVDGKLNESCFVEIQ